MGFGVSRGEEETRVGEGGGGMVFWGALSLHGEETEFERETRGSGKDFASCGGLGRPGRAGGRAEGGGRGQWRLDGGLEVAEEMSAVSSSPFSGLVWL